jgi:predicted secreted hydrolase
MRFGKRNDWTMAIVGVLIGAGFPLKTQEAAENSASSNLRDSQSLAFAYDPDQEEGPHPDADFEWWYQFGFLKRAGAAEYEYSFVSSFQRNKSGRYLFYNLSDLSTGKNLHYALADRSLFGVAEEPAAVQPEGDGEKPPRRTAGLGQRLARWLQDNLPVLPEGHKFMTPPSAGSGDPRRAREPPGPAAELPKSELWLDYDDHCFHKDGAVYRAVYKHPDFCLDLTLQRSGPALPVLGTGLTGLAKPEDQHYYTYPRLPARGQMRIGEEAEMSVEGSFWYDHQWGKVVTKVPMRWCWWGLRLEDGRNLSLFLLQDSGSGKTVQKGLTVQNPDGRVEVHRDLIFTPGRSWKSPHGRSYRVEWQVEAREMNLTIQIRAQTDDHEIPVLLYRWIWEGPCLVEVRRAGGEMVKGSGFQEMIGQAHVE